MRPGEVGVPRGVCAGVSLGGGGWRREAQLCSLIFWERSGGVVDPPAPFSSAGSRRISAAASLHKATLCDLPQAHKYNCNQERREGGGTVDSGGTRRKRPLTVPRPHHCRWKMKTNIRAPLILSQIIYFLTPAHVNVCKRKRILLQICKAPHMRTFSGK